MNVASLKREIKLLNSQLNADGETIRILFHFHRKDEPHGFMGSQWITVSDRRNSFSEAATTEEELKGFSRIEYESMVQNYPHMKTKPDHSYGTYEKWLESHRCKCGHHGEDGKQPFLGITTLLKEYEALPPEEKAAQTEETLEAYKNGEIPPKIVDDKGTVVYRDLPQSVILDRKHGIRKFAPGDLDKICKEQYGENHASYDTEKDCCKVTFEKVKPVPMQVDRFKMGYH